ncbi:MAG: glycosyltransferase [Phycisphaeraceae bacterium]|nr:glycosyltransferase [Phycisphaeraceae bacterium]
MIPLRRDTPMPRVALAHDWLVGYRGGEAVLDAIACVVSREARPACLLAMFDDGRPLTPAIDALPRTISALNSLPLAASRLRRWLLPMYPLAVMDLSRRLQTLHAHEPIDLLISTSSAAVKGLRAPRGVPHLCYCHAPARYLWSQTEEYASGSFGLARRAGLGILGGPLRRWDAATAANVTEFIANSSHTAEHVRRCYGRNSTVVHPPVRTDFFTPAPPGSPPAHAGSDAQAGFWLVVSALEPYKRIDLAIQAANRTGRPLVIAGHGSQEAHLRSLAGPGVRFVGRVSDEKLRDLYRSAALLLFPQVEDFGIVAGEALACGLPVVARRAGGALDIVTDGVTGSLFDYPTVESLLDGIGRAPDSRSSAGACRRAAERFGADVFAAAMSQRISAALRRDR